MSYLSHFLNQGKPNEPVVKSFSSIESLLSTVIPPGTINESTTAPSKEEKAKTERAALAIEEANKAINEAKEYAKKILKTLAEAKQEEKAAKVAEKVNEEIKKDLQLAFLKDAVANTNDSLLESESFTQEAEDATKDHYKFYRDRDETFECKISVEGSSLVNSTARLMLETDQWNIFFTGKIYADGRCVVPIKRLAILPEKCIGKARFEVVIDDNIFVPWEQTFIVISKKITVEIKPMSNNS